MRRALSTRQAQVYSMLLDGLSDREIAERCGTTWNTGRRHVTDVLNKLGVGSRMELILKVRAHERKRLAQLEQENRELREQLGQPA